MSTQRYDSLTKIKIVIKRPLDSLTSEDFSLNLRCYYSFISYQCLSVFIIITHQMSSSGSEGWHAAVQFRAHNGSLGRGTRGSQGSWVSGCWPM